MAAKKAPAKKAAPAKKVAPAKKATAKKPASDDIYSDEYVDKTRGPKPTRADARYGRALSRQINRSMGMTRSSSISRGVSNMGSIFGRGGGGLPKGGK